MRIVLEFAVNGLPDVSIVIPTYWAPASSHAPEGGAVYDHPTSLDEEGTLGRLLESLHALDIDSFLVVVIVGVTDSKAESAAYEKVLSIAHQHRNLKIVIVAREESDKLKEVVSDGLADDLLGLTGYARVRNLQLAVPLLLGSRSIVALDDDEVVTDESFLKKATEPIGSTIEGERVEGLSGYYVNPDGGILLGVSPEVAAAKSIFDRKAAIMNAGTERLEAQSGRIVPTPFCFGGNMIFSSRLASQVAFDPCITRGEDIDYLINARLAGMTYFMNKDLKILHLPPAGGSYQDVAYHKVVQDVLRFVYEREKVRHSSELGSQPLTASDLSPYPGDFLAETLDKDAREVIGRIFDKASPNELAALVPGETVQEFMSFAYQRATRGVEMYRAYQSTWRNLTASLASADLRSWFQGRIINQDKAVAIP